MLKGRETPEDLDEESESTIDGLFRNEPPLAYNPSVPIETFDIIEAVNRAQSRDVVLQSEPIRTT